MTNKEIQNIYFQDNEVNALYMGVDLIWKKENGGGNIGSGVFSGVFNSTINSNNNIVTAHYEDKAYESIHIPYDKTSREFNYTFAKPLEYITLTNRNIYQSITHFPTQSKLVDCSYYFNYCTATTLDLSNIKVDNITNMSGMFTHCDNLTNVIGTFEGTKLDLDLHWSPLTTQSAMVFINGLATVEATKTLKLSATTYDTLTNEQIAIATSKGWTVSRG